MRKARKLLWITVLAWAAISLAAYGCGGEAEHEHKEHAEEHGQGPAHEHGDEGHQGEDIRQAEVDGYQFLYELIDVRAKMEGKQGVDLSKLKSHHLMVFITGPDGKPVTDAKVGYMLVGPDGSEQKVMAMAMAGGFGGDVDFKESGSYEITTKAVFGEKTLMDKFTYEMK
jgi:hypothetical protein